MIWFNVEEAREFLLKHRMVYTLRKPRSVGFHRVFTFKNGKKLSLGVAIVELVKDVNGPDDVEQFVNQSGLSTAGEWYTRAVGLSGNVLRLYKVTMCEKI